jgi:hypothetical protein
MTVEEAYNKPIQQRNRMSMQTIKMRVTQGYSMIGYQQWENTVKYLLKEYNYPVAISRAEITYPFGVHPCFFVRFVLLNL